jgi:predicted RNase H-like HicB family nuclease
MNEVPMDDNRRVRPPLARSKRRERISLLTGLLGLASAIALGVLLYTGRDYTDETEPGWWWNTLVVCGLVTGIFWIASIAFGSGRRASPVTPPPAPTGPHSHPEPLPRGALHAWAERPASSEYEPGPGTPVAPPWEEAEDPTRWDVAASPAGDLDDEAPLEYAEQPLEYTAVYWRSDGGWAVEVEEVPDCRARASTLYEARERVVQSLTEAGYDVESVEVVDDVELPPEAADAISAAQSDDGALAHAAALLVDELELDETDAAALLGISRAEVEKALLEEGPLVPADETDDVQPVEEDAGDDDLDDEVAVEHISPYDTSPSR